MTKILEFYECFEYSTFMKLIKYLQVREADRATALAILAQDTQAQLGLLPTVGWAYEHTA